MVVCKFFLEGRCKFGDQCRHEHPGQSGASAAQQSRDVFATSNRQPGNRLEPLEDRMSGFPGGRGRGGRNHVASFTQNAPPPRSGGRGFQPRDSNRDRRNDVTNHRDSYGITAAGLESELKNNRPIWIMSCYGPGDAPPIQLFGGHPLEQSPEELRVAHKLASANGNPQEYTKLEQDLAALSNQQVENVLNDLHGAIEYVAAGKNQHPNRLDDLKDIDRSVRHGLFTTSNQRAHRGVFRDQRRPPRESPPARFASNATSISSQLQGQSFPHNPPFGVNAASNGFGAPSGIAHPPSLGFGQQPHFGQIGFSSQQPSQSGFTNPPSSFGGFPQASQQPTQNAFNQSQRATNNGFAQPFGTAPAPQIAQQSSTTFGQPRQQLGLGPPGSLMDSNAPSNNFGGQQFGNMNNVASSNPTDATSGTFGANTAQSSGLLDGSHGANGAFGNPGVANNVFAGPDMSNPTAANTNGNGFSNGFGGAAQTNGIGNGVSSSNNGQNAGESELEQTYRYMKQHGQFKDGIMPETPPEPMWLT